MTAMENAPTSIDHIPKSTAQAEAPKKKQYRATTTWHLKPYTPPNLIEGIARVDLGPLEMYEAKGEVFNRGPVPTLPLLAENVFILKFALLPFLTQYLVMTYAWPYLTATYPSLVPSLSTTAIKAIQYILYQVWFDVFALNVLKRCQSMMQRYGTLNENVRGRDLTPDSHHVRVIAGLVIFSFVRNIGVFSLTSAEDKLSAIPSFSLWSVPKMSAYLIALDYWFYLYHRSTHEIDALWFVHRQHHATKSPTPSMSLWADDIQDSLEWAIVPFLAFSVVRLNFAELYTTSMYLLYVEAMGHSGVRAYLIHPLMGWWQKHFDIELAVEDHDLHHRYGRGGRNYGKQTRIWDKLFGTIAKREEEDRYNDVLRKLAANKSA